MAALIYIASEAEPDTPLKEHGSLLLESSPVYWFLYRYFEDANLDRSHPLIDLYGGGPMSGYQLERLAAELDNAAIDAGARGNEWKVLVGWNGVEKAKQAEDWQVVRQVKVMEIIGTMRAMIDVCLKKDLVLICSGD